MAQQIYGLPNVPKRGSGYPRRLSNMATITAKKSEKPDAVETLKLDQRRPTEARYRLQVAFQPITGTLPPLVPLCQPASRNMRDIVPQGRDYPAHPRATASADPGLSIGRVIARAPGSCPVRQTSSTVAAGFPSPALAGQPVRGQVSIAVRAAAPYPAALACKYWHCQ
jgi:hypothetical protein